MADSKKHSGSDTTQPPQQESLEKLRGDIRVFQMEYQNDKRWLFRSFGIVVTSLAIILAILFGATLNAIPTKINELFASTTFQQASDSMRVIKDRAELQSKSIDSLLTKAIRLSHFDFFIGSTDPANTDWQVDEYGDLNVRVNTSHFGFKTIPFYLASLEGTGNHYEAVGVHSLYKKDENGFTVYLKFAGGKKISPQFARSNQWQINWVAVLEK